MDFTPGLIKQANEQNVLVPFAFDYIGCNYSDSLTDVYTYKVGGSGGTTVATVTVTWTSTAKTVLSTIART